MLSLHVRLLISYSLLLIITLSAFAVTFLLAISTYPAPPQPTYQQLAGIVQGLNLNDMVEEFRQDEPTQQGNALPPGSNRPQGNPPPQDDQIISVRILRLSELLADFAETREVRVLIMRFRPEEASLVLYDSDETLERGDMLPIHMDNYRLPPSQYPFSPQGNLIFGSFGDDGEEWLFTGIGGTGITEQNATVMIATVRPTQSLQGALADYNSAVIPPLLRAGAIGLVVAVLFAFFITRTIAQPLQAASAAATAVAEGDLGQTVPVTGPPEVRAVALAFNRMSAEVLATQQAQRDFMANVSHDLKTPLTSIQGYSQAIIDGAAKDQTRAAEIIHDEATRLNRMVIDLTDLARIQAGQFSMHLTTVDVGEIATAVASSLRVVAENKGVALVADAPSMPPINGDGDRLVQILTNLIGNAIKFTPQGGEVRIATRQNGRGVEITVQDNGMGIPKDELPRVFERFYQVDKARGPSRGTGLGLAITYQIVQAHRGRVEVQSSEGQGTTFTVWLPAS
jgi:signal transduction histidine kinase